jgi:hypothetical protein
MRSVSIHELNFNDASSRKGDITAGGRPILLLPPTSLPPGQLVPDQLNSLSGVNLDRREQFLCFVFRFCLTNNFAAP